MYLSRVQINPGRRFARKVLGSPQVMHATVLQSFPQPAEERGRILWRLDAQDHKTLLYVVSPLQPDFSHIVEQAGWPTTDETWMCRSYDSLLASLASDQQWAFRLTANPVHNKRLSQTEETQRLGHVTVEQQEKWFLNRCENWGFCVNPQNGTPNFVVHDRHTDRFLRQGQTVTLTKATFDGILTVTNPDALRNSLISGIGHGKAYGCGLLTLAPINANND